MLQINNLHFSYQNTPTLKNISFEVGTGEIHALIGESGSGKSTLLRLIYGLLDAEKGSMYWNGHEIKGPSHYLVPGMPFIKYVSQDFDIMPFVSVAENIGQYLSNIYREEKHNRIDELLKIIHLEHLKDTPTKNLSGGQKQRVALAQALAKKPEVLILDEPFAHIDAHLKNRIARNLFSYTSKENITVLFSTHNATDALHFAKKIITMKDGEIIRHSTPQELYNNPQNRYEAELTGDISIIDSRFFNQFPNKTLLLRPHHLKINMTNNEGIEARVTQSYFNGNQYLIEVEFEENKLQLIHPQPIETNTFVKIILN